MKQPLKTRPKHPPFIAVQVVYAGGRNRELDRLLAKEAGRESDGSGQLLIGDRERDHSWYFETGQDREAAELASALRARFPRLKIAAQDARFPQLKITVQRIDPGT